MPNKIAVTVCLGDYYGRHTSFSSLEYAYNNANDINDKLRQAGWSVFPPIIDETATKDYCIKYLNEKIDLLKTDDWLLFYFVGHGSKYITSRYDDAPVYMVTSLYNTGYRDIPNSYFRDVDYKVIVDKFHAVASNGHLITVLDCCYAFGVIDSYMSGQTFHTIFAASDGTTESEYSYGDNSFFFSSFKKSWDKQSLIEVKESVENSMLNDYTNYGSINFCQIQIAENFKNSKF